MNAVKIPLTHCLHPVRVLVTRNGRTEYIYAGCGRCALCMNKKKAEWVFRLTQTAKHTQFNYFLTLTYSDEYLPKIGDNGTKDFTKFMKRFRKNNKEILGEKFKYFRISELGEKYGRLHFHFIAFGTNMSFWQMKSALENSWAFGFVDIKSVTPGRIKYCCSYCVNQEGEHKRYKPRRIYENGKLKIVCRQAPINYFVRTMSKGIGIEFLTPDMLYYLCKRGDGTFIENGYIKQLPKYYLSKVFEGEQLEQIKDLRFNKAVENYESEFQTRLEHHMGCSEIHFENRVLDRHKQAYQAVENLSSEAFRIRRRCKQYRYTTPQRKRPKHITEISNYND